MFELTLQCCVLKINLHFVYLSYHVVSDEGIYVNLESCGLTHIFYEKEAEGSDQI